MSGSLEHFDGCFPVTGLKEFWLGASNLLLQGQGPFVSVVDVASGKLLHKTKVFRRSNVHGFMIDELRCQEQGRISVLAWGGSSLRIIDIHGQRDAGDLRVVCGSLEHAAPDWIYDMCPAHIEDSDSLAYLVTGHNSVLSINTKKTVDSKYPNAIQLRHVFAGVKSTLYSANILALSASHVLIAAGTVFGEIIVWSCFKHDFKGAIARSVQYSSSIHHFFTGHEGSIFGVNISGELPLVEGKPGRLLASCSDDRTVRIWNISDCCYATSADQAAYATDGFDLRSTGFGSTAPAKMSSGSESAVAKCWGHVSRIWGVYFLPIRTEYPNVVNLVSRGEDATSQLWRLDLTGAQSNGDMKLDLTNVATLSRHAGKHIWSLALSRRDDDTKLIYTGGNDGTVRMYELTYSRKDCNNGEEPSINISPYSPKALLGAARAKINNHDLVPRFFAFVSSDSFIITYVSGLVQLGTLLTTSHNPPPAATANPDISWENLAVAEDLRSFSSISALSRYGLAVIGGSTGILRLYNHSTKALTELTKLPSRPVKVIMLDADFISSKEGHSFRFMVTYPGSKNAELFDVEVAGSSNSYTIGKKTELVCPRSLEITTGSIVCHGKYLAVGGKLGQLLFYKLDARKESLECSFINHRAHGQSTITFINPIEDAEDPNVGYALTGGRDGKYCVYRLHCQSDRGVGPYDFQIIHRSSAFLSQIEDAYFNHKTGHFMVLGFRGNVLILWDETTQTEILALDCGGVHRVWEFMPNPDALGAATIVWIQARSLHVLVAESAVHRPLQLGAHGREVKSLAITKPRTKTGNGRNLSRAPLIASGGEDTLIRISTRSQDKDSMWNPVECLHIMGDHVSGLQQIKWSDNGRFLFSSAGREEFFAWRIRSVPKFGLVTLMEAACPREEFETELRIMSFDVLRMQSAADEDRFLLALVYSNSTIKVFSYTSSAGTHAFELLGKGTYSTNCLTEVYFVGDSDSRFALVTGATDGYLAFWPLQWITHSRIDGHTTVTSLSPTTSVPSARTIEWETHHAIHTSSIKSLEVAEISPGFQALVGGGDDNSLSVTLVKLDSVVRVVCSISISNAHASAITAVKILRSSMSSGAATLSVVSTGNDQRLKLWSVTVDMEAALSVAQNQAIGISLESDRYCPVADIAAMEIMEVGDGPAVERVLVICGVGMEMVRLF